MHNSKKKRFILVLNKSKYIWLRYLLLQNKQIPLLGIPLEIQPAYRFMLTFLESFSFGFLNLLMYTDNLFAQLSC